ncbi:hypothetical protein SSAG_00074 [Streptomyces sp. Mg1]|nr:hypothetical protein SSAG_00074 [Streptomyces sp. Mg1]
MDASAVRNAAGRRTSRRTPPREGDFARPWWGGNRVTGRLRLIGRTVPLCLDAARQLAEHLTPAGAGHPWTGARFSST